MGEKRRENSWRRGVGKVEGESWGGRNRVNHLGGDIKNEKKREGQEYYVKRKI